MLRVVVTEDGQGALPPVDLDVDLDRDFVIGDAEDARVRLPAAALGGQRVVVRAADIGAGKTFVLGRYRVHVAPAPPGAVATPPQRTASLARELLRGLLGGDSAPSLTIERGAHAGASRALAPPESTLVIGRGDEAGWIIDDADLSRAHVEVRRGWDGVRVVDLESKNGTRVDGVQVAPGGDGVALGDGAVVELGGLAMRLRDPAERYLRGEAVAGAIGHARDGDGAVAAPPAATSEVVGVRARNAVVFWLAIGVLVAAIAGLAWLTTAA